jgi:hypothetical protein
MSLYQFNKRYPVVKIVMLSVFSIRPYFQKNFNDSLPATVDTFLFLVGSYRHGKFFLIRDRLGMLTTCLLLKNVKSSWILGQFSTIFKTDTVQSKCFLMRKEVKKY